MKGAIVSGVRSALNARPTAPLGTPQPSAGKECMLRIVHRLTAVAIRLIVSLLKVLQVRVAAAMARMRLNQVKADFTVLSMQPGGRLGDYVMCPSTGFLTMPSRLPSLDEFVSSFLTDGFLRASDYLLVDRTGELLAEPKRLQSFLRQ